VDSETSDHLLCLAKPHTTEKKSTVMRKSIPAEYSVDLIFHRHVSDLQMFINSVEHSFGQFRVSLVLKAQEQSLAKASVNVLRHNITNH
jgi:hypothetical protein